MIARRKCGDRRRKQKRKVFSWLMVLCMVLTMFTPQFANADEGDTPAHSKTASDNGDGTYTLELSVTGDADDVSENESHVNVLIIYDESSSMSNAAGNGYTRADNAENAMYRFVNGLVGYQNQGIDICMAEVGFGTGVNTRSGWTTTLTTIRGHFDNGLDGTVNRGAHGNYGYNGTNWAQAFDRADTLLNGLTNVSGVDRSGYPTFVVLVTDGAPTASPGNSTTVPGANVPWTSYRVHYRAAVEDANSIQSRDNTTLYGIYAFGTDANLLDDLMYYANTGNHRVINGANINTANQNAYNFGNDDGADYYYTAANAGALDQAIEDIFSQIVEAMGITAVSISDGTTNQVETSTGVSELLEIDESSYQYWLSIPVVNNQFTRTLNVTVDGVTRAEEVTYTVTANSNNTCTVNWTEGGVAKSVTVDGSVSSGIFKYEWTASNDLYKFNPPAAQLNDGSVDWNLNSVGTLLDGVTYSVTFKVYPSQETLDDVADIKNNPGPNGAWKDLDPAVQQYIDVDGNLKTNTTATLTYSDSRLQNPGPKTSTYKNPGPVENSAVEQMAITKEWDNALENTWEKPKSIVLNVTRDDDPHYTVTLSEANEWKGSVYVSIGIMGADGQPLEGSEGHDFTFTEPTIQGSNYKWEIDAPTVHPMLINNKPTMLIKVDAKHPIPSGATTYAFNNATYYVDDEAVSLTATNERRSSINLVKAVDGEDAPEDAIFPFTLHVNDSLAPATAPSETEDPNHDSDYWIWISVRDKDGNRINEGIGGATSAGEGWWYAPNDTDVTIPVKDGYSIRVNNLPVGSTYKITEGDVPAGFVFESAAIAFTDGRQPATDWTFSGGQTSTGSINTTNAVYTVTYTNKYELVDINVDKVWDDNSDQDGIRPDDLALTLNGAPAGYSVPDPVIEKDDNTNTWTYTWKAMPRYDAEGNELTYTVTEEEVPQGYTCGMTTVSDGGIITNVHEPEVIEVKATKVWQDDNNQDGLRPNTITLRLGTEAEDGTVTPVADQPAKTIPKDATGAALTVKWTDLPKYKDGEEIKYTVTEDSVDDYTTNITGDPATGFTVTNIHVSEKRSFEVQKIWDDSHDKDGHRPDKITVYLYADGEQVDEQEVSGTGDTWSYLWDNTLPKYNNGVEIVYTAREKTEGESWAQYYNQKEGQPVIVDTDTQTKITNSHESDKTSFQVWKIWDDENNQDGLRPESIEVQLLEDGQPSTRDDAKVTLNEQNHWTYKWDNLEENKEVTAVEVTPDEDASDNGGTQKAAPAVEEESTDLVTDAEGDGEAVESEDSVEAPADEPAADTDSTEAVESDDSVEAPADEPAADGTAPEKRNAPAKAATKIKYEAQLVIQPVNGYETPVYETVEGGVEITNKHVPDKTKVTVTKVWNDENDQDGKRADVSATVQLYANGEAVKSDPVEVGTADNWSYTWENLDVNVGGQPIVYTVQEELPENSEYTMESIAPANGVTAQKGDSGTITVKNKYTPEVIDIPVKKIWDDADNQDGIRPESVTVKLLADGTETDKTVTLSESNQWTDTFTKLPKNSSGTPIEYTIEEVEEGVITGKDTGTTYAISYGEKEDGTLTVTNKHTPRTTSISVTKEWKDGDNQDGYRPTAEQFKAIVHLYANGTELKDDEGNPLYTPTVTDNGDGTFTISFTGLPENAMGSKITWTVGEDTAAEILEKYQVEGDAVVGNGGTITNKHDPEKTQITVRKVWEDADDQDGIRPEKITVALLAGGEETGKTVELTADNQWTNTFENLDVKADGEDIVYSIDELEVEGYDAEIGDLTEVTDEETGEVTGYTVDITNTHEPEQTQITVSKAWDDADNQDGIRPEKITAVLLAGGKETGKTIELTADNEWTNTFENLDVNADGKEIVYSIDEIEVEGYETEIGKLTEVKDEETGKVTGYTVDITNTHKPETVTINGTKTWKDSEYEGQPGYERPESITVNLKAAVDGEAIDLADLKLPEGYETSKTVTESDNWKFSFENLPKNLPGAVGKTVTYSVEETPVPGYDASQGELAYDIDNTPVDKEEVVTPVELTINKTDVNTNHPLAGATFTITKDGKQVGDPQMTGETGSVKFKFEEAGTYTLTETPPTGYKAVGPWTIEVSKSGVDKVEYNGDSNKWNWFYHLYFASGLAYEDGTLTIPNTPEETSVEATKVWDDKDNIAGLRQDVTIHLDKKVGDTVTEDCQPAKTIKKDAKDEALTVKWDKLPAYEDGMKVAYTVREDKLDGYEKPAITGDAEEGYTITNTMKFGDVRITKDLLTYEDSSQATFVYSVKATVKVGDKDVTVYDGMATLDFTSATTASAVIKDLPAGAVVEVKEVYSGAAYNQKSGPAWDVDDQTIVADGEIGVEFSNAYNGELTQGYGILNECEAEGGDWVNLKQIVNSNEPEKEPEE